MDGRLASEAGRSQTPRSVRADLEIKIALWTDLIGDPACILDVHQEHWRTMMADFSLFMHAAEHPERYPELKEAS